MHKFEQAYEKQEQEDQQDDEFKSVADLRKQPLPFDLEKDFPDLLQLDDPKPEPIQPEVEQKPADKNGKESSASDFRIDDSLGAKGPGLGDLLVQDRLAGLGSEDGTPGQQSLAGMQLDYSKVKDLAKQLKDESKTQQSNGMADGFEEIKHSEAWNEQAKEDYRMQKSLAEFDDVGMDSVYPLMTSDPTKAREFTVKINSKHLDNVLNPNGTSQSNSNLQSIIIQENYIPA